MAQPVKHPKAKKGETVVLLNLGRRTYQTESGEILPGKALEVTLKEAKQLGYEDLVDLETYSPKKHETQRLVEENSELKKKIAELEKQIGDLKPPKK